MFEKYDIQLIKQISNEQATKKEAQQCLKYSNFLVYCSGWQRIATKVTKVTVSNKAKFHSQLDQVIDKPD